MGKNRRVPIFQCLDSVGDGSGDINVIGDYSSALTQFTFRGTGSHRIAIINRMIIGIEDGGSFDSGAYGNGVGLTNGIKLNIKDADDNVLEELTSIPIKTNADWAMQCHDLSVFTFGSGNEVASIRWTFGNSGQPLVISLAGGEYLSLDLNDDLSGLVKHHFTIQGYYDTTWAL